MSEPSSDLQFCALTGSDDPSRPTFGSTSRRCLGIDDLRDLWNQQTPLAANANVFLDDFLLFDVAKPITDQSHLEIQTAREAR
jgi:hypothetical protein